MLKMNLKKKIEKIFKIIYFILGFLLGLFLFLEIRNHILCLEGELADLCYTYYSDTLLETILKNILIFSIIIPIYYLIRWIYLIFFTNFE